jgi:hypothetical protein
VTLTRIQIPEPPLVANDKQRSNSEVRHNRRGTAPPHHGVTDEVHLSVVLHPEVLRGVSGARATTTRTTNGAYDSAPEPGPVLRPRVVRVSVGQTGVGRPHDSLELEELLKEARAGVIDLLGVEGDWEISVN